MAKVKAKDLAVLASYLPRGSLARIVKKLL